jgi:hypothetical protein
VKRKRHGTSGKIIFIDCYFVVRRNGKIIGSRNNPREVVHYNPHLMCFGCEGQSYIAKFLRAGTINIDR